MKKVMLTALAVVLAAAGCRDGAAQGEAPTEKTVLVDPGQVQAADLKAAVTDSRVRRFYDARDWQPAWTEATAPQLVEALKGAARHGLDPDDYIAPVEAAKGAAGRETALTRAALDLADTLGNGKTDPHKIFSIYTLPGPQIDLVAALGEALADGDVGEWLAQLAPDDAEYRALSRAYLEQARLAAEGAGRAIASGSSIHAGESDPRVPRIVAVLRDNGYLSGARQKDEANLYSEAVADAIEEMQDDFGILADGIVGPDTLEVLNTGPRERARTLAVNLERRRWLERSPPATRIDVNVAAAMLDYYRDGERRDRRKVIVGQPGWETPHLGSAMFRLVANPTWTVPKSIEEEEIAGRGSAYLRRNHMVRRDGWIVQLPGPDNALGQVKFDLQNDQAIYLHDTPAVSLFERSQRQLSHGCVRVDNALQFARMLARDAGILSQYERARTSGEETFVDLPQDIPVRLLYFTAFTDPAGKVRYRMDPYGWDDRVAEALGYERRQTQHLQTHVSDIGP